MPASPSGTSTSVAPSDTTTVSVSPSRSISPAAGRVSRIWPGCVPSRRVVSSRMSQSKSSMAAGRASRCMPTSSAGTGCDGICDCMYSQPPTMPTATAITTTAAPSIRRRALRSFGDMPPGAPWLGDHGGTAPAWARSPSGGDRSTGAAAGTRGGWCRRPPASRARRVRPARRCPWPGRPRSRRPRRRRRPPATPAGAPFAAAAVAARAQQRGVALVERHDGLGRPRRPAVAAPGGPARRADRHEPAGERRRRRVALRSPAGPAATTTGASGPSSSGTTSEWSRRAISVPMVVSARERHLTGDRLDEHQRQRVHVAAAVERLAPRLLGRGVAGGAEHRAGRLGPPRLGDGPGQPEVGDAQPAVGAEQQVRRLDVAVDEPLAVGVVERPRRLEAHQQCLGGRQPVTGVEHRAQRCRPPGTR